MNTTLKNEINKENIFLRNQIEENQNQKTSIQYFCPYEKLPIITSEHINLFSIRKITTLLSVKGFKWEEIFQVITQLRVIHKNFPNLFYKIFNFCYKQLRVIHKNFPNLFYKIFNFCYKTVESKIFEMNQKISINLLLLLSEVFSKKFNENTNEFYYQLNYLKVFLDKIIKNSVSINRIENGILKMQCIVCISNICVVQNSYQALLVILKYLINNEKNFFISEQTFKLIEEIIKNIDVSNLLSQSNYQPLIKLIINLYFVKKLNYQKYAFNLIKMLKDKNLNLLNLNLDNNELNFLRIIEDYGFTHSKKKDFSKSLKIIQKDKLEHLYGIKNVNKENNFISINL